MHEKTIDRRVRKTKQQLRLGLTELLREKPVKDITVRELADRVDINRGTFYLHYRDVFDMVEQIENELFEQFREIINAESLQDVDGRPLHLLKSVFQFLADNADMGAALLGPTGDIAFVDKLKKLVRDKCLHDWMPMFDTEKTIMFEPYCSFVVGGVIALFQAWLETGQKQSPEQMARMAELFIVEGARVIKKRDTRHV